MNNPWEEAARAVQAQFVCKIHTEGCNPKCTICRCEININLAFGLAANAVAKIMKANPPPVAEAFAWIDSYEKLKVDIKVLTQVSAFPVVVPISKKYYWMIEVPPDVTIPKEE